MLGIPPTFDALRQVWFRSRFEGLAQAAVKQDTAGLERVLDKPTEDGYGFFDVKYDWHVRDVKRFDEFVVVLMGGRYLSGYPGIRRETVTCVYPDAKCTVYRAEDVYIDGGYQTYHLDRPNRDFKEILGSRWDRDCVVVRLKDPNPKGVVGEVRCVCKPESGAG